MQPDRTSPHPRILPGLVIALALSLALLRPVASAPAAGHAVFYPGASLRFGHLSVEDGLSQNTITALLQDEQGYIWVGTQDGLNRYDGYTFTQFRNFPSDPKSISANSISALLEDDGGTMWIGTSGGGLDRYDPSDETFTRFLPDPKDPISLGSASVTTLLQGTNGRIWVGTLGGLDLLDPATGRFTHFQSRENDPLTLSSDSISALAQAGGGKIWVGTSAFGTSGSGLNRLDLSTGKVERIPPDGLCLNSPNISSLLVDQSGSLWVGNGGSGLPGGGLDTWNPVSGNCQHFDSGSTHGQFINDNVTQLMLDREYRLWVAFRGGGVVHMEPGTPGTFSSVRHDSSDPDSLSSDNVSTLFQDRSGVLWMGSFDAGPQPAQPGKPAVPHL